MKVRLNMEWFFQAEFGFARRAIDNAKKHQGEKKTRLIIMNGFVFKGTYDILERLILSNIRRKLQLLDKIINTGWRRINQMPINIIMGKRNAKFFSRLFK